MRAKFALPFATMIVLVCTILMVEVERGSSQQPPQEGGKKNKGGGKKGGFGGDPGDRFDRMAKGESTITISTNFFLSKDEALAHFVKDNGITNDKLTKADYVKYSEQRDEIMKKYGIENGGFGKKGKGGFDFGKKGDFKKGPDAGPDAKKKEAPDPKAIEKAIDEQAEKDFAKYDANTDGFLNKEEIAETRFFKSEWEKWDENKDGLISLGEWKNYYRDMRKKQFEAREKRDEAKKNGKKVVMEEEDDEERIIVYRLGKMPEGMPDWFKELDVAPKDGQVSLYEWQIAGKDIEEFVAMDRNDDGFLTAEEVVRFQRLASEKLQRATQLTTASTINGSGIKLVVGGKKGDDPGGMYGKKGKGNKGKGPKGP